MELECNGYTISDDKSRLRPDDVCRLLRMTFWAKDRPRETVEKTIANSLCFGVYRQDRLLGFARCVTDFATVYWLSDVIIDEPCRGQGLGKALVGAVVNHPLLAGCTGMLKTRDAPDLYAAFGFQPVTERFMSRRTEI